MKRQADSVPGRYVSKRERKLINNQSNVSESSGTGVSHDMESILPTYDPSVKRKPCLCLPKAVSERYTGHTKEVNCVRWNPSSNYPSLVASASMDHTVRVWDVLHRKKHLCTIPHTHAVRDAQWGLDGRCLAYGGFSAAVIVTAVETGQVTYKADMPGESHVRVVRWHPEGGPLLLVGCDDGVIATVDTREHSLKFSSRLYKTGLPVLDLAFHPEGKMFFSSHLETRRKGVGKNVLAWDFAACAPISLTPMYPQPFGCPSLRMHPDGSYLYALNSIGEIVSFSAQAPKYSQRKNMTYAGGHTVDACQIQFGLGGFRGANPLGHWQGWLVSGSADGSVAFYDIPSKRLCRKLEHVHALCCSDAEPHPSLGGIVVTASWDRTLAVLR